MLSPPAMEAKTRTPRGAKPFTTRSFGLAFASLLTLVTIAAATTIATAEPLDTAADTTPDTTRDTTRDTAPDNALDRIRATGRVDEALLERLREVDTVEIVLVYELDERVARAVDPGLARRAAVARGRERLLSRVSSLNFSPGLELSSVPVLVGVIDVHGLLALSNAPNVLRIGLNTHFEIQLAEAVPLVGLTTLHASGYEGSGVQIATIDTGVDGAHLDLSDSLVDEQCFCTGGCCPSGGDTESGVGAATDDHGHGTRVAGVLTSNGTSAPLGGADHSQLVAVKTMNSGGGGTLTDIVAGLNWILSDHPDVDIVNMSIGSGLYPGDCDADDATTMALAAAIDPLWNSGVLVVAGSGNDGASAGMLAPACLSNTVSVGAVWDADVGSRTVHGCTDAATAADQITCFSNSSATTDLVAPGARMKTSLFGGGVITSNGTSYASPMVAACAAVLLEKYPGTTPDEFAAALSISTTTVIDSKNGLGYPRLDCPTAAAVLASATVPSLSPMGFSVLLLALFGIALVRMRKPSGR